MIDGRPSGGARGTVIVTGATGGIGAALTERLAADGHPLHLMGRAVAVLRARAESVSAACTTLDLTDEDAVRRFCDGWTEPIFGLVHNAGTVRVGRVDGPDEAAAWAETLAVNLVAPYLLMNGLLDRIVDGGRVVTIASQLGRVGRAGYGAYCASKFALVGASKCWALELGGRRITVNSVLPSWVSTPQALGDAQRQAEASGVDVETHLQAATSRLELGRMTSPEEVASLVSFLLSDDAAGISGQDWLLTAAPG